MVFLSFYQSCPARPAEERVRGVGAPALGADPREVSAYYRRRLPNSKAAPFKDFSRRGVDKAFQVLALLRELQWLSVLGNGWMLPSAMGCESKLRWVFA